MNSSLAKAATEARARRVASRTRGHSHGPITRLVSPSDVGRLIKPFVFLDYFDIDPEHMPAIGFHPHSGIATLTLLLKGRISYEETSGTKGIIEPGGVEWMRAGGGVWHTGGAAGTARAKAISYGSLFRRRWRASHPKRSISEASTSSRRGRHASSLAASAKPRARFPRRRR